MWLTGLDGRRRFVNRAYAEFLGCDGQAALEFDWRTILHPDDRDRILQGALAGEATLEPFTLEGRYRRHDGAWRWLHSISQPSFDENGVSNGFIGVVFDLTETRQAERELKAREQQLSAYVNQTAAGFGEVDLSGRFTRVNDRFCEITGYSREQLLERTMQSITHPDDLPRNVPLFEAAVAHGTPYHHEKRYVRPDGSIVWVNNSVSVIRDASGAFASVLAVSIDVSEHRRIAGELHRAEERLRLATESGRIGTWDWDLIGRQGEWSGETRRILGLDPDATVMLETGHQAVIHPEDRQAFLDLFAERIRDGGEIEFECRAVRPDGAVRWIASRGIVLRDGDSRAVRMLGTIQDVTERREARDELERLNRSLESKVAERTAERDGMWRLSHDLLLVLDSRLRILAVNPSVTDLTGFAAEEVIGRPLRSLILGADWQTVRRVVTAGRRAPVRNVEARLVARDGSIRAFCWNAAPEKGRAYVSGRDITAEQQHMGELLSAQEALRQAQKLEAIGQLTGGVAHDFNNLLSPIIGSLDLLRHRQVGGEREQRLIAGALQSADRAKVLVQRLLAFARRQPLTLQAVDIATLVEGLRDLLLSTLGAAVELRVAIERPLAPVLADPNQLEMAILNLAVNARDAMPDGGVLTIAAANAVDTGTETGTGDGGFVWLDIVDTGCGMDAATLARATEPFFSSKGIGKGTGLGLSMVEGLTAQLGGELQIRSRPGQGTSVRLCLPVAQVPAPGAPPHPARIDAGGEVRGRILLVEDEALVRMATAEILRDRGFTVTEVETAAAALDHLAGGAAIDCVVTDHLMPGMSGIDLARRLAAEQPSLPVLLVTGYAELEALGSEQPFLGKPFDTDELVARIIALIQGG